MKNSCECNRRNDCGCRNDCDCNQGCGLGGAGIVLVLFILLILIFGCIGPRPYPYY